MNGFANIESAALQAMDDASDYFEALSDLLQTPEYDPFEASFFAEVYSENEGEFLSGLRKASAIADSRIRIDAMAFVIERLVGRAE